MSANSGTSVQGINMSGMIDSLNRSIKNNNSLNYLMRGGKNDIPYAFMGIATIVIAGFTYVTYKDYADEVASGISDTLETIQSSELFIPSKEEEAAPFFSEPQEPKEETKEEPKEENKVNVDVIEEKEESKEETEKSKEESKEEKEESKEEKPEEPGEQYKLGGTKQKRKTKRKRKTEKRKRKN